MDYILVGSVLVIALSAVVKYFLDLGKQPQSGSIHCSGCNSGCHTDFPENEDYGLLRQLK